MKTAHVVLLVIHLAGIVALLVGLLVQVTARRRRSTG